MKKLTCISFCLILVFGCGPGLIYPHLDWLIPWYVDGYISLNRDQSSMLKSRLMQQLDWHCQTQLSVYVAHIREIAADFDLSSPPVTYAILESHYNRLRMHWRDLMRQIAPDVGDILISAKDQQIEELFSNLEKENREWRSEYMDPPADELLDNRREKMRKRLEYWISSLTEEQKQALQDWNLSLQPISEDWLQNQVRIQVELRRLLAGRSDADEFRATLSEMLMYPERGRPPEYQKKLAYNTAVTLNFIVTIDRMITSDQRKKLIRRLNDLAEDFDRLSCEPKEKVAGLTFFLPGANVF
jgi:hypothetical protein